MSYINKCLAEFFPPHFDVYIDLVCCCSTNNLRRACRRRRPVGGQPVAPDKVRRALAMIGGTCRVNKGKALLRTIGGVERDLVVDFRQFSNPAATLELDGRQPGAGWLQICMAA